MHGQYVIGVDIGTQSTKAALFDVNGICLAAAAEKSHLHQPGPGIVEEDPERQVDSVCRTIRQCVQSAGVPLHEVAGIGIDGQMAGIIGIGRDGRAITPYDSWLDTRCAPYIGKMKAVANEEIIGKTGGPPSFNHGPKILRWKKEFPRIYRSIRSFVQPGGYAVMRLCGLDGAAAFIDRTYLHFSGFADNRRGCWDEELCRRFGVPPEKLPRIVEPRAIMGSLCASMAGRCGLKAGVPVVAGCGDTAASFLACGATREGVCVDVAGTASVFAATTKKFLPDLKRQVLSCGSAATPGLWHPYAYINGGGMNVEWFRGIIATAGGGADSKLSFNDFENLAAKVPLTDSLPLFVPHLAGRVSPSWPHLRGAWAGLTLQHGLGHLCRAVLEAVALEYGIYKKVLQELRPGLALREVRRTGGGGGSELWNQIKADALGMKIVPVTRGEGAPLGAALLAAHGVGLVPDLAGAADAWIQKEKGISPVRKHAAIYAVRQARFEKLLEALNVWSCEIVTGNKRKLMRKIVLNTIAAAVSIAALIGNPAWAAPESPLTPRVVKGVFGEALNAAVSAAEAAKELPSYKATPLTVELWCKLNSRKNFNILVSNEPKESATHWEICTDVETGILSVYIASVTPSLIRTQTDVTDGKWHYVAMVLDDLHVALYIDGDEAVNVEVAKNSGGETIDGPFCIGKVMSGGNTAFDCDGAIDDVRVSHCARGILGVPHEPLKADAQTVGLWSFDLVPGAQDFADASVNKSPMR